MYSHNYIVLHNGNSLRQSNDCLFLYYSFLYSLFHFLLFSCSLLFFSSASLFCTPSLFLPVLLSSFYYLSVRIQLKTCDASIHHSGTMARTKQKQRQVPRLDLCACVFFYLRLPSDFVTDDLTSPNLATHNSNPEFNNKWTRCFRALQQGQGCHYIKCGRRVEDPADGILFISPYPPPFRHAPSPHRCPDRKVMFY